MAWDLITVSRGCAFKSWKVEVRSAKIKMYFILKISFLDFVKANPSDDQSNKR
jgi:hypothetical protein